MEILHQAPILDDVSCNSLNETYSGAPGDTFFQFCFPQVNLNHLKNQSTLAFDEAAQYKKKEDNFLLEEKDTGVRRELLTQTFVKFFSQNPAVQQNCEVFSKSISDEQNNIHDAGADKLNVYNLHTVGKNVLQDINRSYELQRDNQHRGKRSRGRPKKEDIPLLICEGSLSESNIKCPLCARVFPFAKGLKTHLLTHSGEKSILCGYPGCPKAFRQTGQRENHIRTHTKEKPFYCPEIGCFTQHAHSHRECPQHPKAKLYRKQESAETIMKRISKHHTREERDWIEDYLNKRDKRVKQLNQRRRSDDGTDKMDIHNGFFMDQVDASKDGSMTPLKPQFPETGSSSGENTEMEHESDESESSESIREDAQTFFFFVQTVKAHHADVPENSPKELFNEALKQLHEPN